MNASFVPFFAAGANFVQANKNQPFRFGNVSPMAAAEFLGMYGLTDYAAGLEIPMGMNYPDGYLTNANANANQYLFFYPGNFDEGALLAGEAAKQPVTVGELLTLPSLPMMNGFAGPILVIAGCECSFSPCPPYFY